MNDLFIAHIIYRETDDHEFITSLSLEEFYYEIWDKLNDRFGEDYPKLLEMSPTNTQIYLGDFTEEEYQDSINKMVSYLNGKGIPTEVSFLRVSPDISENKINRIETDSI